MDAIHEPSVRLISYKKKDCYDIETATAQNDASECNNNGFDVQKNSPSTTTALPSGDQTGAAGRLQLVWSEVTYSVAVGGAMLTERRGRREEKRILQRQSGVLSAGSMTALMGPSGAGKSSLLNCVAGKVRTSGGHVFLRFPDDSSQQGVRIGFVPQTEHLFTQFSVHETLLFASRLNNALFSRAQHAARVQQTLRNLDMEAKRHDKLYRLSGGQLKRVSIGVELVSNPAILMLDEPTSGLDSDNSEKLVRLLKILTSSLSPDVPLIIATIHQPSVDAFLMFDNIYLLNRFGANIFYGPPAQVMDYVVGFGFERKINTNPAEYMTEIANAKYGCDRFPLMTMTADQVFARRRKSGGIEVLLEAVELKQSCSFLTQFALIFGRNLTAYCTKSPAAVAQMVMNTASFIIMINVRVSPIGLESGCWSKIQNLSVPLIEGENRKTFFNTIGENIWDLDFMKLMIRSGECSLFTYIFTIYFLYIPAVAAVTYFPLEVKTVIREVSNNWYSITAYFFAKILSNPLILVIANLPAISYVYFGGGFPVEQYFRFGILFAISLLLAAVWDARGFFFSVAFKGDALRAGMATNGILLLFVFLSGAYVKYEGLNDAVKPLAHISDIKYGFSSVMTALYGYDRCESSMHFVSNNLLARKT